MILIELEERLVALNDEANAGFIFNPDTQEWRPIASRFAAKAYVEGDELEVSQVVALYPNAHLAKIPWPWSAANDP